MASGCLLEAAESLLGHSEEILQEVADEQTSEEV